MSSGQWEFERRFIFIRQEVIKPKKNKNQLSLKYFRYQAIVTNLEEDISPEEIWHQYNQRATVENRIEEIKNGFAVDQNSQKNFLKNYADILIKSIAYNLFNFFKQTLLPANFVKASIRTLRRIFINLPANIVKQDGRKFTVRLPDISVIKEIVENIYKRAIVHVCFSRMLQ